MLGERYLEMHSPGLFVFGKGEANRIGRRVRELGARTAFVVCDPGIAASNILDTVRESLDAEGLAVEVFDRVTPNPATTDIEAGSAALRGLDLAGTAVVAVGGGSSLDAAKGIALHTTNPGPVRRLDFRAEGLHEGLPVVAVPTTAGTGSETNYFGVVTDPDEGKKFYVGHPSVRPKTSVLDPSLTVGLPPDPTAATGMDAMVHALEALMSRNGNPYAEGLALQVIRTVHRWLPAAVSDGKDIEARSQMLLTAHLAGLAFGSGTGLGLCHALAHSISARTGAAHGAALTVVLPQVLNFNLPTGVDKLALAASSLGLEDGSEENNARAAISAIEDLGRQMVRQQALSEVGVEEAMIPTLIRDTLSDIVISNTPRMPSEEDVRGLLINAL